MEFGERGTFKKERINFYFKLIIYNFSFCPKQEEDRKNGFPISFSSGLVAKLNIIITTGCLSLQGFFPFFFPCLVLLLVEKLSCCLRICLPLPSSCFLIFDE
jgi:hypothetical protein